MTAIFQGTSWKIPGKQDADVLQMFIYTSFEFYRHPDMSDCQFSVLFEKLFCDLFNESATEKRTLHNSVLRSGPITQIKDRIRVLQVPHYNPRQGQWSISELQLKVITSSMLEAVPILISWLPAKHCHLCFPLESLLRSICKIKRDKSTSFLMHLSSSC